MDMRFDEGGTSHDATLAVRLPYDWAALLRFLGDRAIPGLETIHGATYSRAICIEGRVGTLTVAPCTGACTAFGVTIRGLDQSRLPAVLARVRHLFDLDADPEAIRAGLARDPLLAQLVAQRPGLRVPGAWDGFELGVRAILGQQVSVSAATKLAGRLVALFGTPLPADVARPDLGLTHLFPTPALLSDADIAPALKMPRSRGNAIRSFAAVLAATPDLLSPGQGLEPAVARLKALPGIGEWTARYIAMRVLREPDAMPVGDIGLLRALDLGQGRPTPAELLARSETWRPWRAYAVMQLWARDSASTPGQGLRARTEMPE